MRRLRNCLCSQLNRVEIRTSALGESQSQIKINPLLCAPWIGSVFKTNKQKIGDNTNPHDWEKGHRKFGSTKKMKSVLVRVHVSM